MRKHGGKSLRVGMVGFALIVCAVVIASTTILALQRYQKVTFLQKSNAYLAFATPVDTALSIKQSKAIQAQAQAKEALAKQKAADAKAAAEAARNAGVVDSAACSRSTTHNDPSKIDVLVNKKHCLQPVSFAPADLQALASASGFSMKSEAASAFDRMVAAAKASGNPISVTSTYRSYAEQVSTYAYWVGISGRDGADTYSARPGYSEHQTGLAVDVSASYNGLVYSLSDFKQTPQYTWLQQNAAAYGFVQRYYAGYENITGYSAEEWHYRYVGIQVATDMKTKGIKTLEQYWGMSGGDY